MERTTFDLLELVWWQNPWYWLGISCAIIILIIIGLIYAVRSFKIWRRLKPYKKLAHQLNKLCLVRMDTYQDQLIVCQQLTTIMKDWTALCYGVRAHQATDEELLSYLECRRVPQEYKECIRNLCMTMVPVKFACTSVHEQQLYGHMQQLKQFMHIQITSWV